MLWFGRPPATRGQYLADIGGQVPEAARGQVPGRYVEVSLTGEQVCIRPSCLRVDHVLRHLRTRFAAQRPVEDADRGGRPNALRNGLAFLPLREEIVGEIAF